MKTARLSTRPRIAPYDAMFYSQDVSATFRWLHENSPIAWVDNRPEYWRPFWLVSSYEDARFVGSHPDLFTVLDGLIFAPPPETAGYHLHGGQEATLDGDPRFEHLINFHDTDPPEHGQRRRIVSRFLTPRRVAELETSIEQTVQEVLDAIPPGWEGDFVSAVAKRVPLYVTADLLGIPRQDLTDIDRWSNLIAQSSEVDGPDPRPVFVEIYDFLEAQLEQRQVVEKDGLIAHLVKAERGGEFISRGELLGNLWTLMLGGYNTTRDALSGGVKILLDQPQQLQLMVTQELYRSATEEVLRWVSPARYNSRTATRATELAGHSISEGDLVVVYWYANNRDPKVWADPFEFRIDRPVDREHLAFGFGTHYCIGAALARAEINSLFQHLFVRFPGLRITGDITVMPCSLLNITTSLPVAFGA